MYGSPVPVQVLFCLGILFSLLTVFERYVPLIFRVLNWIVKRPRFDSNLATTI